MEISNQINLVKLQKQDLRLENQKLVLENKKKKEAEKKEKEKQNEIKERRGATKKIAAAKRPADELKESMENQILKRKKQNEKDMSRTNNQIACYNCDKAFDLQNATAFRSCDTCNSWFCPLFFFKFK